MKIIHYVVIVIACFVIYLFWPTSWSEEDYSPGLDRFVHLNDNSIITYHFNIVNSNSNKNAVYQCSLTKQEKVSSAFNEIEKAVNNSIDFQEVNDSAEIEIYCGGIASEGKYITLGEATFNEIGSVIEDSNITFYAGNDKDSSKTCIQTELHEILHVLGVDHIEDKNSIMNPIDGPKCINKIDEDIINLLNDYY